VTLLLKEHIARIEMDRFGPFTFQLGCQGTEIETLFIRVNDAHQRFRSSPLSQVSSQLEKEVVVSSIFGTNSIEGGALSEEETQQALEIPPSQVQNIEQRRAANLKTAYDLSRQAASDPEWQLDINFIQQIHAAITDQIPHDRNQPGILRDNPKSVATHVGDTAHGGRYKPPQYSADIKTLLQALINWQQDLKTQQAPVLIRASLLHYYYELIHPFWDGNGRVGRVLEATLLQSEGFQYAPFALARYYFDHIDQYFTLFNHCRKQAANKQPYPNNAFIEFFLQGLLLSLNNLHDRVNAIISFLLFETETKRRHDQKQINTRQYAIVSQILSAGGSVSVTELRRAVWYQALYDKLTDKTKQRDLNSLRDQQLVKIDHQNRLWPGCVELDKSKPKGKPDGTHIKAE